MSYQTLFLQQSYRDCTKQYEEILHNPNLPLWDYVVLTASNEAQAQAYRAQISYRLKHQMLPEKTHYAVLPDPDGKRVGSGGATLNVLRYIREHAAGKQSPAAVPHSAVQGDGAAESRQFASAQPGEAACHAFDGKRILVIHSGGDSKRVPQYSACGKLFSPVPRILPNGRRSTLFDEFMIAMCGVAARMNAGMLVCSGDVLLLFNPLQIDFYGKGAAALSIKEPAEIGKNHGVYRRDREGNVGGFLHKKTVEQLHEMGAVDEHGHVDIDTGAVMMSVDLLNSLYSLIDTEEKFAACVNEQARLSFYADFLYPLASNSTLEQYYQETPEGEFTPELSGAASLSDEADPDVTGGIYPFWDNPGAAASDDGGDGAIYASGLAGADQHQQSGKKLWSWQQLYQPACRRWRGKLYRGQLFASRYGCGGALRDLRRDAGRTERSGGYGTAWAKAAGRQVCCPDVRRLRQSEGSGIIWKKDRRTVVDGGSLSDSKYDSGSSICDTACI